MRSHEAWGALSKVLYRPVGQVHVVDADAKPSSKELAGARSDCLRNSQFRILPVAGYLQCAGAARDSTSVRNIEDGARDHRRIAMHATRAGTLQRAQMLLILVIVALLTAVLLLQVIDGGLI